MALFSRDTEDLGEKLKQIEREELEDYCKEQGFTPDETAIFVKNSISRLFDDDSE